jgi:hypothetical protein
MFIHHLRKTCLFFASLLFCLTSSADIYKWVDENGQVHYTQQAPADKTAKQIKTPPPPPLDTENSQKQVDDLIRRQQEAEAQKKQEKAERRERAQEAKAKKENCQTARTSYQRVKDNPGRRMMKEDGSVVYPTKEERQQTLDGLQKQINEFCN